MKSFTFFLVILQAVFIQQCYSQCLRTCGTVAAPVVAVAQPSVANTLADTLSLLTVSSLLAETLPYNPNVVAAVQVPVSSPCASSYTGCGCGCGCGIGGFGLGYGGYYVV